MFTHPNQVLRNNDNNNDSQHDVERNNENEHVVKNSDSKVQTWQGSSNSTGEESQSDDE